MIGTDPDRPNSLPAFPAGFATYVNWSTLPRDLRKNETIEAFLFEENSFGVSSGGNLALVTFENFIEKLTKWLGETPSEEELALKAQLQEVFYKWQSNRANYVNMNR